LLFFTLAPPFANAEKSPPLDLAGAFLPLAAFFGVADLPEVKSIATFSSSATRSAPASAAQALRRSFSSASAGVSLPSTPNMMSGRCRSCSVSSIAAMPTMAARELVISEL